jgi:molybdopterin-guanine dinucleotide biosynthesis protein A
MRLIIPKTGGIVLCGGRSSRMGRPKTWLPFGDELLLQRVVRILQDAVDPVVVVASPTQELPPLSAGVEVVRDDREYLGPLNGLAVGLQALDGRAEVAYLSSCDVPFLKPEFVLRIVERLGNADVCLVEAGGFKHPLAAAYRLTVLPIVRQLLDSGRLRPVFVTEHVATRVLHEGDLADIDPGLRSLRNLNTPEDYQKALSEMREPTS